MDKPGFEKAATSPCSFLRRGRGIKMAVHGDQFVSEGAKEDLKWFDQALAKEFEIKTEILGPDEVEVKELRVVNRVICWEEDGLEWEADQRHAELIISQLDLSEAKAVITPGVKDEGRPKNVKEQEDEIVIFSRGSCTRTRREPSSRTSSTSSGSRESLRR